MNDIESHGDGSSISSRSIVAFTSSSEVVEGLLIITLRQLVLHNTCVNLH